MHLSKLYIRHFTEIVNWQEDRDDSRSIYASAHRPVFRLCLNTALQTLTPNTIRTKVLRPTVEKCCLRQITASPPCVNFYKSFTSDEKKKFVLILLSLNVACF